MIVYIKDGVAPVPIAQAKNGVHFIQMEGGGPINIGVTQDLEKQFSLLQRANPYSLIIVGFIPCNDQQTAAQHDHGLRERFAKYRIHSDWYQASPEIVEYVHSTRPIPIAPAKYRTNGPPIAASEPPSDALLSPQQLSERLGVSVPTIRRLIQQGIIPYERVGTQLRFDLGEVRKAMAAAAARQKR